MVRPLRKRVLRFLWGRSSLYCKQIMNILEIRLLLYYHNKVFQKRELEVIDANVGVASTDSRLIYCVIVSIYYSFDRRFDYG